MDLFLKDRVIVINGGTKGLGRGIALGVAAEGGRLVIGGRNENDGMEVIDRIKEISDSEAIFFKGDVKEVKNCQGLIDAAQRQFGRIDGLVNYTGITTQSEITETDEDLYYDVFDTNLKSAFFCCKYAIKSMLVSGGGSIVNIGSTMGYGGTKKHAAYACSKGAMLTLTRHISKNYAENKIRANWVTMGWVLTPNEVKLLGSGGRDINSMEERGREVMPMGRMQTVEDNVPAVLYLLSDISDQVTGTELHVSGGFFAGKDVL